MLRIVVRVEKLTHDSLIFKLIISRRPDKVSTLYMQKNIFERQKSSHDGILNEETRLIISFARLK